EDDEAAGADALDERLVVRRIAGLVGVDVGEVDLLEAGKSLSRGADLDRDPVGDLRPLQVASGDLGVVLADLEARQVAAGREAAGDADGAIARERAHLDRAGGA